MKNWATDKILGTGLIVALFIFLVGQFACILCGRDPLPLDPATNIISGLIGYMGRSLLDKLRKEGNDDNPKH